MAAIQESKLELFSQWLQVNGAQLRGCSIEYCGPSKGFGIFSNTAQQPEDGVIMVVPLDLAITPMRVLQDPMYGPACSEMYKQEDVDDRFLVMLFLTVERKRPDSPWKPWIQDRAIVASSRDRIDTDTNMFGIVGYIDILPSSFTSPLWFTDDELSELKGTSLYRATKLQKQSLEDLFENKVKNLVSDILHSNGAFQGPAEVNFEDFLWANSIFWSRALNIPFPYSYVFPSLEIAHSEFQSMGDKLQPLVAFSHEHRNKSEVSPHSGIVWAEGLIPGIDFCNHSLTATATWEVDDTGSKSGICSSMYLFLGNSGQSAREIFINYGDKGNEELLYLYGFTLDENKDDYIMIHYPVGAFHILPSAEAKAELLKAQGAEMRCLLPSQLLDQGFYSQEDSKNVSKGSSAVPCCSLNGRRNVPSYWDKLVFPAEFLASLRTIAMNEQELNCASSFLKELIASNGNKQSCENEIRFAIAEICGDFGALQLLVDILQARVMELEECSGNAEFDCELLQNCHSKHSENYSASKENPGEGISTKKRSTIVYRRGQKRLTRLFLREAEHALGLCLAGNT